MHLFYCHDCIGKSGKSVENSATSLLRNNKYENVRQYTTPSKTGYDMRVLSTQRKCWPNFVIRTNISPKRRVMFGPNFRPVRGLA